jgi:hypothetical protein
MVVAGQRHPKPGKSCSQLFYEQVLLPCWTVALVDRPSFQQLAMTVASFGRWTFLIPS